MAVVKTVSYLLSAVVAHVLRPVLYTKWEILVSVTVASRHEKTPCRNRGLGV